MKRLLSVLSLLICVAAPVWAAAPPPPSDLQAGELTGTSVKLKWTPSAGAFAYQVHGGAYTQVSTNWAVMSGLTPNTEYTFGVQAIGPGIMAQYSRRSDIKVRTALVTPIPTVPPTPPPQTTNLKPPAGCTLAGTIKKPKFYFELYECPE